MSELEDLHDNEMSWKEKAPRIRLRSWTSYAVSEAFYQGAGERPGFDSLPLVSYLWMLFLIWHIVGFAHAAMESPLTQPVHNTECGPLGWFLSPKRYSAGHPGFFRQYLLLLVGHGVRPVLLDLSGYPAEKETQCE